MNTCRRPIPWIRPEPARGLLRLATWALVGGAAVTGSAAPDPTPPPVAPPSVPTHLMRYADIHGDRIVFTYEDDLWLVPEPGRRRPPPHQPPGRRVPAPSSAPTAAGSPSPASTTAAPTSTSCGAGRRAPAPDLPSRPRPGAGLVPRRQAASSSVAARTTRSARWSSTVVTGDGGMPEKLPVDRGGAAQPSRPTARRLAYNRIPREHRTWKRYQGGMAQDIWVADFASGSHRAQSPTGPAPTTSPCGIGEGIYFTSDREDGTLNIYRHRSGGRAAPCRADALPRLRRQVPLEPAPASIVFQYGGAAARPRPGHRRRHRSRDRASAQRPRRTCGPSWSRSSPRSAPSASHPRGERVLLEARGEILNLPAEEGERR